jgi:hypothetical protein
MIASDQKSDSPTHQAREPNHPLRLKTDGGHQRSKIPHRFTTWFTKNGTPPSAVPREGDASSKTCFPPVRSPLKHFTWCSVRRQSSVETESVANLGQQDIGDVKEM